jgi:WD40 repeat protein
MRPDVSLGATSISFSKENSSEFIVGTETGFILKGTLDKFSKLSQDSQMNVVLFGYESHIGPTQALDYSPFYRKLFLSCGSDGCVKLFDSFATKPKLIFEPCGHPLTRVAWSPSISSVFACSSMEGQVYIFDLSLNSTVPVECILANQEGLPITSMEWNHARNFMATGDANGIVKIFQLPNALSEPRALSTTLIFE